MAYKRHNSFLPNPPGLTNMLGKLISALDALIYTFLAFIVPFYWTCKALLRQFTHSTAMPLPSLVEESIVPQTAEAEDDGEVPMTSIPSSFASSDAKPVASINAPIASTSASTSNQLNQSVLVNWLYYWALLSVFHVLTGAYELAIIPLLGNSFLYRLGKLGVLVWMNHDANGAPARLAWNSLVGPLVSAYERDVDALIARCQVALRTGAARAFASGRAFVQSKISSVVEPEAEALKVD